MYRSAIPILRVTNIGQAESFYCGPLEFDVEFRYQPSDSADPTYLGIVRDGARIHLSSFTGDGVPGGIVYVVVDQIDRLYERLSESGIVPELSPTDQTWGNREMYVRDPSGNTVRFVQPLASDGT